ncbi:MAG: TetR/AcrR family transcriptional regulator [Xanthomonadaceae bacterium]|jgi:TetR/AcrR family transcriptional repressor of nem operon|nr:TetR/AcrR family transcriptional regulator [Xanthomonadaceae bacterium]
MNSDRTGVRQSILDAAKPIILGKGFSAVGLNEILGAAAVPKGSFYHYFKSKELFGEALLDSYFSDYLAQVEALLSRPGSSAAERLMSYWQQWLLVQAGECPQGKCLAVKLGGEVSDLSEPMRLALHRGTDRIIERLARCIHEGIVDGSLPASLDPRHSAKTLYELWLGATLLSKFRLDRSALDGAMLATRHWLQLPASGAPSG